eukprot:scaffold4840_cov115-Isochrysis_galbana.AAC.25
MGTSGDPSPTVSDGGEQRCREEDTGGTGARERALAPRLSARAGVVFVWATGGKTGGGGTDSQRSPGPDFVLPMRTDLKTATGSRVRICGGRGSPCRPARTFVCPYIVME